MQWPVSPRGGALLPVSCPDSGLPCAAARAWPISQALLRALAAPVCWSGPVRPLLSFVQQTRRAKLFRTGGPFRGWEPFPLLLRVHRAKGGLGQEAGHGGQRVWREGQQVSSKRDGFPVQSGKILAAFHVVQGRLDEVRSLPDEPPAKRASQEGGGDEAYGDCRSDRAYELGPDSAGALV